MIAERMNKIGETERDRVRESALNPNSQHFLDFKLAKNLLHGNRYSTQRPNNQPFWCV